MKDGNRILICISKKVISITAEKSLSPMTILLKNFFSFHFVKQYINININNI